MFIFIKSNFVISEFALVEFVYRLEKENLHLDNYAAQTICMGTYHAVSLLGERGVNIEFTPIQSCRSLLDRIREAISIDYKSTLEMLYERQYSKDDIIWR